MIQWRLDPNLDLYLNQLLFLFLGLLRELHPVGEKAKTKAKS